MPAPNLFLIGVRETQAATAYRCTPSRDGPRTTSYVGARRVLS